MKTILLLAWIITSYGMAVWYLAYRLSMWMVRKVAVRLIGNDLETIKDNKMEFDKFLKRLSDEADKLPGFVTLFYNPAWIERLAKGLVGRTESIQSMIGETAGSAALVFVGVLLLIGFVTIDMLVIMGFALINKFAIISIGLILFGISVLMICAEFLMIRSARIIRSAELYAVVFLGLIVAFSWVVTEYVLQWSF